MLDDALDEVDELDDDALDELDDEPDGADEVDGLVPLEAAVVAEADPDGEVDAVAEAGEAAPVFGAEAEALAVVFSLAAAPLEWFAPAVDVVALPLHEGTTQTPGDGE